MTDTERFAAIAARLTPGGILEGAARLRGGVSAEVHALTISSAGTGRRDVVVRQHDVSSHAGQQAERISREHTLLTALFRAGLPVPEPLLLDTSCELLPAPFLVMSFVPGTTGIAPERLSACLDVMADCLADVHDFPTDALPPLPARLDPLPETFDYLPGGERWRALRRHLQACTDSAYTAAPVLLHGDFWPGNLLWQDGHLAAILDWEDAAVGDPLSDLASCRLELTWKFGQPAADRVTRRYAARRPLDARRLRLWEVYVAAAAQHFMAQWGLDPALEKHMRQGAEAFIDTAGQALLEARSPR